VLTQASAKIRATRYGAAAFARFAGDYSGWLAEP
jgi:hypothetical protein